MNAAIIGGGLAGCSVAYRLSQLGLDVTLFEQEERLAQGGSGNFAALYHRYLHSSSNSPMSKFMRCAHKSFDQLTGEFDKESIRNDVGVFQFPGTGRLKKLIQSGDHNEEVVSAKDLEQLIGFSVSSDAFYFSDGGWMDPRLLCDLYIKNSSTKVTYRTKIDIHKKDNKWLGEYDYLVLANAMMSADYLQKVNLRLSPLKGQVFWFSKANELPHCFAYDGYLTPCINGFHMLGATFEREKYDTQFEEQRVSEVLDRLNKWIPGLISEEKFSTKGRASVRAVSYDKIPYIGELEENCFTSIAHGSRGLVSSAWAADAISGAINKDQKVNHETLKLTSPLRRAL